jgi:hypothetical protein
MHLAMAHTEDELLRDKICNIFCYVIPQTFCKIATCSSLHPIMMIWPIKLMKKMIMIFNKKLD